MLDPSALMHHDFKKWIDDHPELLAANPNLVAAAAAAMALNSAPSFHSHVSIKSFYLCFKNFLHFITNLILYYLKCIICKIFFLYSFIK